MPEPKDPKEKSRDLRSYLEEINNELSQQETEDTDKAILDDMKEKLFSKDPDDWDKFIKTALERDNMLKYEIEIQEMIENRIEPLRKSSDPNDKATIGVLVVKLRELTQVIH